MILALWNSFCSWISQAGLPVVFCYHIICENAFLNMADSNAKGLEWVGNVFLTPVQYLLNGKEFTRNALDPNQFQVESHFNYTKHFPLKISGAVITAPFSLILGSIIKSLAYICCDVREKHHAFVTWRTSPIINSHLNRYRSLGMAVDEFLEPLSFKNNPRRPGDENHMSGEKECLRAIVDIFKKHHLVFWVDCGTCLGVYRHGGVIPWDCDIDLAILQEDFDNVKHALTELDPTRYYVEDWSGRDRPKSYLKVYDRKSNALIDIYHFKIDPKTKTLSVILSNENSIFLFESWKIRERRYIIPTPFDIIFPLRKAYFDGIEVYVPNQIEKYLQMRYGENLTPVKIYNPKTDTYEKDLSHPYWKLSHVK